MSNDDAPTGADAYTFHPENVHGEPRSAEERRRRETHLEELLSMIDPEADEFLSDPRLSREHRSWLEWREATGELPPDFQRMPAVADLPDPLRREEDGEWTRVATPETWERQRDRLGEQLQYWLYGELPPAPGNVEATVQETRRGDGATVRDVQLAFGPDREATLDLRLMIPDGDGPFPAFMTQWNHDKWAEMALGRGYVGVVYAGNDSRDDAADYDELYPEYDFQLLARRAWAAHRVVDYLHTLPEVDRDRIALTGHSRNGKQSLIAAAFDDRITAVAPSSSGSGGVVPARFDRDDFYAGDMSFHARLRRSWFHPRWRFFVGRENRLPVDANSLVSMVAPRACLLHAATHELSSSSWAVAQVYRSAQSVYELLDAEDDLAVHYRPGDHGIAPRDVHRIIDFFDFAFDRGEFENPTEFPHGAPARDASRTPDVDVEQFPERGLDDLLVDEDGGEIRTPEEWAAKKPAVRERIRWSFGERPPSAPDPSTLGFEEVTRGYGRADYLAEIIGRVEPSGTVGSPWLSPYETAGEPFEGDLYFPKAEGEERPEGELPAVVWLHPFSYNTGYGTAGRGQVPVEAATDRGFALYAFDQLGFGTRLAEGKRFEDRYPDWSRMGKLVADARAAVSTLDALEFVDSERIYLLGYSLGATVGLYAAALDERVAGVASVCGIPAFRLTDSEKERAHEVVGRFSDLHGLHPRLGPFRDAPGRTPFDFHEVLGLIAPRSLLAVAPEHDWTHPQADALRCVEAAREVYALTGDRDRLDVYTPSDRLGFDYHEARLTEGVGGFGSERAAELPVSPDRRTAVFDWLADRASKSDETR